MNRDEDAISKNLQTFTTIIDLAHVEGFLIRRCRSLRWSGRSRLS